MAKTLRDLIREGSAVASPAPSAPAARPSLKALVDSGEAQVAPAAETPKPAPAWQGALGKLASTLGGAVEGESLGFAGEIVGANTALGDTVRGLVANPADVLNPGAVFRRALAGYRKGRDSLQGALHVAHDANPKLNLTGEVAGGLLVPVPGGGVAKSGLKLGARALQAAKEGMLLGAASALGKSEADLTTGAPEAFADAALSEALGAGFGGVAGAGGTVVGEKLLRPLATRAAKGLSDFAERRAVKAAGPMLKDYRLLKERGQLQQLGRDLLDRGVVTAGATLDDIAQRAGRVTDDAGAEIRTLLGKLDEAAVGPKVQREVPDALAQALPEGPAPQYAGAAAPRGPRASYSDASAQGLGAAAEGAPVAYPGAPAAPRAPRRSYSEMSASPSPASPASVPGAASGPAAEYAGALARLRAAKGPGVGPAAPGARQPRDVQSVLEEVAADPERARAFRVRPDVLADRIERELIAPLADNPLAQHVVHTLRGQADNLRALGQRAAQDEGGRVATLTGKRPVRDTLSFQEANALKRGLDDMLDHTREQTFEKEMLKRVRGIINDEMEQRAAALAEKADPSLYTRWKEAKRLYGEFTPAADFAEDRALRNEANRFLSPSDYGVGSTVGAVGALATGGDGLSGLLLAATAAGANKLARERGPQVAAATSDALARALRRGGSAAMPERAARVLSSLERAKLQAWADALRRRQDAPPETR